MFIAKKFYEEGSKEFMFHSFTYEELFSIGWRVSIKGAA